MSSDIKQIGNNTVTIGIAAKLAISDITLTLLNQIVVSGIMINVSAI
ncbi:hypothetical protein KUL118_02780 [Tenacibaculum sp. KUL118]|nr:hypothetical protein KUL118_02780 [Tenacibaculum sp. KUL118]